MIQGTMSSVGKSLITAGLCRVFSQDGYLAAPFKSQNMALNSFITAEGLEMGRAQAMQAEAAGKAPDVRMNPILLKPTSESRSQVILMGKSCGNMRAREYFDKKPEYIPLIMDAYNSLADENDIIVIEGAGSPVEINLKKNDIVNMGMAKMADARVLLVGDIDRGGVFAQLLGTMELLEPDERDRVEGLIINKFRGDRTILEPGLKMLEEKCRKPVFGVVPWSDVKLEDEDSLSDGLLKKGKGTGIDIAVIRLKWISNFTDTDAFGIDEDVSVRYVERPDDLGDPDMVLIPGSKNTIADMKLLKENGMEASIRRLADRGTVIFGICGGYQIMGRNIDDEVGTEGGGKIVTGYEIHMGRSTYLKEEPSCFTQVYITNADGTGEAVPAMEGCVEGSCIGTYIHGIFDDTDLREALIDMLYERRGIVRDKKNRGSYLEYRQEQYDRLAGILRESMDIDKIYRMMKIR